VQTTHKIPGGSATRWSRYLISRASRGDYYTHDGKDGESAPTGWHGPEQLLRSYGIDPARPVELEHLRSLMHGFSPADGEPIRPAGSDRTRVAAIDVTFSPPKDVSALWATADPYRRAQIEVAHRKAVKSALERTEREVALVRRKRDGVVHFERAGGLLAVESVHTTSRLGKDQDQDGIPDPQLHSHVAIIAAQRVDGQVAAVESRQLFRAAREGGAWYRAELAANLGELGLSVERREGKNERYFGIWGVPEQLSDHWSSRSEDVDQAARQFRTRYGREPRPGELDSLTLGTRGAKSAAPSTDINAAWRALGEEHGLTKERAEELFNTWDRHQDPNPNLREELLAEVTRERSMIATRELKAKAYELSAGVCRPAQADHLVDELARSGELVALEEGMWTTRELRETELATIETASERAREHGAAVSERALAQARREIGREIKGSLTEEQREALDTITGAGGIAVLVGRAGTGKGVVIATAARSWELEGKTVIATAVAGSRAQQLRDEARLDHAYTTDALLYRTAKGTINLDRSTVVVMDEAAMADSKRMARLVELTAQRETKLLLVGDSAQLSSIGPGGLFKELEGKVPTAELTEVHRAQHEWERKAWEQIRNGEPGPALAQYRAHERLHIHDTRAQAAQAMVENWDQTRQRLQDGQAVMITDASNKERDEINAMAQERRAQAGELGAHRVSLPGKPYGLAAGDEIVFTAQYRIPQQRRVENGIAGTVIDTSRDEEKITIKTKEREPRELDVNTSEFSDLSLAYAVHVHKSQGITAQTSGILTGGWQTDKEHAYVAVSRAREQTQIYVAREDLGEQGMDTGAIERLAERIQTTRAQQATITKNKIELEQPQPEHERSRQRTPQPRREPEPSAQREPQPQHEHDRDPRRTRQPRREREADDDATPRDQAGNEREKNAGRTPSPQPLEAKGPVAISLSEARPQHIKISTIDLGEIKLANAQNLYTIHSATGQPTHILFGAWETDREQGYVVVTHTEEQTQVHITAESPSEQTIETELIDRIGAVIEQSQTNVHENGVDQDAATHEPDRTTAESDRDHQQDQPLQLEPPTQGIEPPEHATTQTIDEQQDRDQTPDRDCDEADRDRDADQLIREQPNEHEIDQDRDNDLGFGIE
jgi:conjugative relaxase-like TrwC/TraI family protein